MNTVGLVRNVLILGAGKIGAFYDTPADKAVLTHAHAFSTHPSFNLIGFVDSSPLQAQKAADRWGSQAYDSLESAFQNHRIDLVVVATPDNTHADLLLTLAEKPIQGVLAEKPLALSSQEAEIISKSYKSAGITLAINYSRRYIPEFLRLAERIQDNEFGQFLAGTAYYGKGLFHNGSHLLDQALMLLGELHMITATGSILDFCADDPSINAILRTSQGSELRIQAVDSRKVTQYELDLLFEQGRIRIFDLGRRLEISGIQEDAQYTKYPTYQIQEQQVTSSDQALSNAADNISSVLAGRESLKCGTLQAVQVLKLCEEIHRASHSALPAV